MSRKKTLHVAVGVIENSKNEILISKRQSYQDHPGLWEFPGGKLQDNESVTEALAREFKEELDIEIHEQRPLIQILHSYIDYTVLLDVWKINKWSGHAQGREGQKIQWQCKNKLQDRYYPEANKSIIQAIQLSDIYFITPEPALYEEEFFLERVSSIIKSGVGLMQFRCKTQPIIEHHALIKNISNICKQYNAKLVINTFPENDILEIADGLHINSQLLKSLSVRPISNDRLFSVSCHTEQEVKKAKEIDADMILLGPVNNTSSHLEKTGIGWQQFKEIRSNCNIPVYALGGMSIEDMEDAWQHGAQGVAMINHLWANQKNT